MKSSDLGPAPRIGFAHWSEAGTDTAAESRVGGHSHGSTTSRIPVVMAHQIRSDTMTIFSKALFMRRSCRRAATMTAVLALGAGPPAWSSAGGSGGGASAAGQPAIELGFLTSVTGALAPDFGTDAVKGFEARIDAQNAAGGVDGRELAVAVADNTSNPNDETTAVDSLIRKNVLIIGAADALLYAGYRPTTQQNIPVVGL